jgi:hypothetical protein
MPSTFSASKEDILRSKSITPGVYTGVVKSVTQKAAKTDGSTNTVFTFVIQGSPNGIFDGVPVDALFSEKAPGFAAELISILQGKKWEGEPVDLDNAVGKKVKIHVVNDVYNGRKTNKIDGYMPIGS